MMFGFSVTAELDRSLLTEALLERREHQPEEQENDDLLELLAADQLGAGDGLWL